MKAFSCPDCGASIKCADFSTSTIECPYCNSSVIVPEELRPPPPPRPRQNITQAPNVRGRIVSFIIFSAICITFVIVMRMVRSHDQESSTTSYQASSSKPAVTKASIVTPPVALTFGNKGPGVGSFQNAHGIALDGNGNLYVSDETLRIQKFNASGKFVSTLTLPPAQNSGDTESGPVRLFTDNAGRVYAVNGGAVVEFDGSSGKRLGTLGGPDYVEDAVLKLDGGFILISWKNENSNLVYLDADGAELKSIPGFLRKKIKDTVTLLVSAMRLALDGHGNTYVVYALGTYNGREHYDTNPIAVYKFAPDGNYLGKFGIEGRGPDQLEMPTAIAIDHQNHIYISEVTGDIKVFDDIGNYLMTLKTPHAVRAMAFDKDNNLYIGGASKVSQLILKD